jgi:hypothetical protein
MIENELKIPLKFNGDVDYEWMGDFIIDLDKEQQGTISNKLNLNE